MTVTQTPTIRTSVFTSTWNGRKGTSTTYRTGRSTTGLRVDVMVWADTPEVAEVRLIEGDGRTSNFTEHRTATVPTHIGETVAIEWLS